MGEILVKAIGQVPKRPPLTGRQLIARYVDASGCPPMIAETGYSVPSVVAWLVRCGWDVEVVKEVLPDLTSNQIRAAVAYACQNPGDRATSIARRHWLAWVASKACCPKV